MAAALAPGCGNDRSAAARATARTSADEPTRAPRAETPDAPTVQLVVASPPPGARTVAVALDDGPPRRAAVAADGRVELRLEASAADVELVLGEQRGRGALEVRVPVTPSTLPTTLGAAGPLHPPVEQTVAWAGRASTLRIDPSPDLTAFAGALGGPWHRADEPVPTGTGVIDLVDGSAYYQGVPGPWSHARYLATSRAVEVPACDGRATAVELDVSVRDRFAGLVVGKQRFRPAPDCGAPAATPRVVAPSVVRSWLHAQFVAPGLE
jgi:hypothetical protein